MAPRPSRETREAVTAMDNPIRVVIVFLLNFLPFSMYLSITTATVPSRSEIDEVIAAMNTRAYMRKPKNGPTAPILSNTV